MMRLLERFFTAFREDLEHFAFIGSEVLHGRLWPEPDVILPPVKQAEVVREHGCTKADLSAVAILEFVQSQGKKSTVFDGYVAAERRREVMTDEQVDGHESHS